jgi:hypothetical protein
MLPNRRFVSNERNSLTASRGKFCRPSFKPARQTTRTRIDLGLALKDTKGPKRLIETGGLAKKDRITHRIEITSVKDIDAEVKKWLKIAYETDR